jgi:hypothetical protein
MNGINSIHGFNMRKSFIPVESPYPIDNLSSTAKSAMLGSIESRKRSGAFGVRLLYSGYTGPIMAIKKGGTNSTTNVYDVNGFLRINTTSSSQLLTDWLGTGTTAYILTWFDQTGNGYNANSVNSPTYDYTNNTVDFTNGYFDLSNGAYPYGNTTYTYIFTPYNFSGLDGTAQAIHGGGGSGSNGGTNASCLTFIKSTPKLGCSWWGGDICIDSASNIVGTKIAHCYPGTTSGSVKFYYNNVAVPNTTMIFQNSSRTRAQLDTNNYLGYHNGGTYAKQYTGTLQFFYWAQASLDTNINDIKILCNT